MEKANPSDKITSNSRAELRIYISISHFSTYCLFVCTKIFVVN